MPCYAPQKGYYSRVLNKSGKRSIVFNSRDAIDDRSLIIPCGQCIGCRLERSRQWAIRCVHENSLYKEACFLTLTYSTPNLPFGNTLVLDDIQRFVKRLRKHFEPSLLRIFGCGEYGEENHRPHYHLCVMNADFPDKEFHQTTGKGDTLWTSKILEGLWPLGFSIIGDLTFESAAYVARYVTKKITGKDAAKHYENVLPTGEIVDRLPEFPIHPRRPGLGKPWLEKYLADVYPDDFVVLRNRKMRPPKFYDGVMEKTRPYEFDDIKERRQKNAKLNQHENNPDRLSVKEKIKTKKLQLLQRKI